MKSSKLSKYIFKIQLHTKNSIRWYNILIFSLDESANDPASLQSEIHNWLHSSKQSSKRTSKLGSSKLDSASDFSDSDLDVLATGGSRGKFEIV